MNRTSRILLIVFAMLMSSTVSAQTYLFYKTDNIHNQLRLNSITGEVLQIQEDGQQFLINPAITSKGGKANRYILYKTKNIWTFILLDKFTGKLWQCQFSVEGRKYMGSWLINPNVLSTSNTSKFIIQPMASMFQYYLINQDTGDMWKFQWSTEGKDYRWIKKFK